MSVLVDTSALLALLNADDRIHDAVHGEWSALIAEGATLISTSYVLIETFALVQNRLGLEAVRTLREDICPALIIEWIGPELHEAGVNALLSAGRRQLSLVDCVSFETMRRLGVTKALSLDSHFQEQGFKVVPERDLQGTSETV